jgi:hypothetical protein
LTENNNDNVQKQDETPPSSPVISDMQEVNKKSQDESEVENNNIQCNTDISHQCKNHQLIFETCYLIGCQNFREPI